MIVIGITGIIGSGKTTTSNILREKGLVVVDLDVLAKKAVLLKEVQKEIATRLGGEFVEHGNIVVSRLKEAVFSNKEKLQILEDIIHPRVRSELDREIQKASTEGKQSIIVDAPLLYETDLYKSLDRVVVVSAAMDIIKDRLKKRGHTDEDILNRISNQIPLKEKEARADAVVFNNGTRKDLERSTEGLLRRIKEWEVVDAS